MPMALLATERCYGLLRPAGNCALTGIIRGPLPLQTLNTLHVDTMLKPY